MIVSEAIDRGDKKKLLSFNLNEKPVALQLEALHQNYYQMHLKLEKSLVMMR